MQDQNRVTVAQALQKSQKLVARTLPESLSKNLPHIAQYQVWTYSRFPGRKETRVSKKKRYVDGFIFIFLIDHAGHIGKAPFISIHRTRLVHKDFVKLLHEVDTNCETLLHNRIKAKKAQKTKHYIPRHKRKPHFYASQR